MRRYSFFLFAKLTLILALSSTVARAHEVVPTIADLTVMDGRAELSLQINLEAFLAGVDLDAFEDTNDAPQAADYDALHALPPEALAARADDLLAGWNALPVLSIDGTALPLRTVDIEVPETAGSDLPRISSWQLAADAPSGTLITVTWPDGGGALVVRQQDVTEPFTGLISGGSSSPPIDLSGGNAQNGWQAFGSYIPIGFDHILPKGLDHILFVLGLFLLSVHLRPLIWQVSAFTLAHTITLALGALGLVNVPPSIVEPLIAASIIYVAIENIFFQKLNTWRPVIVFLFGLLHGLGFASVLEEFGLPQAQFVPALLGFNVGVELGQIAVIAMAFVVICIAVFGARRARLEGAEELVTEYPVMFRAVSVTGSVLIAIIAAYWVIERTLL